MKKEERLKRIIARGEHSNHSHVIVGDAVIRNEEDQIVVEVGKEGAVLRHILETEWMEGKEVWTGEHHDVDLKEGRYTYVAQKEFDPFEKIIVNVID